VFFHSLCYVGYWAHIHIHNEYAYTYIYTHMTTCVCIHVHLHVHAYAYSFTQVTGCLSGIETQASTRICPTCKSAITKKHPLQHRTPYTYTHTPVTLDPGWLASTVGSRKGRCCTHTHTRAHNTHTRTCGVRSRLACLDRGKSRGSMLPGSSPEVEFLARVTYKGQLERATKVSLYAPVYKRVYVFVCVCVYT
jgi:hypothetical protein